MKRSDNGPDATEGADPSTPLRLYRAGAVGVHGYLRLKIEAAIEQAGPLPEAAAETIFLLLYREARIDPVLTDLVKKATGKSTGPPHPVCARERGEAAEDGGRPRRT